jgi:hypothetical protein
MALWVRYGYRFISLTITVILGLNWGVCKRIKQGEDGHDKITGFHNPTSRTAIGSDDELSVSARLVREAPGLSSQWKVDDTE